MKNIDTYYFKGQSELKRNNYNVALNNFLHFIQMEELRSVLYKSKLMYSYMADSSLYNVSFDYEPVFDFYNIGLKMSQQQKDQVAEFKFINNLIGLYCGIKKLRLADKYNDLML